MRNLRFVTGRNLSSFLDNKMNIALSCLAIVSIMSVYFVFLRNFTFQMVEDKGIPMAQCGLVSDRLMVGGLLSVVNAVTCLGGIWLRIKDKEEGFNQQKLASPISKGTVAFGYLLSCATISTSFTVLTYILYEFYFYYRYGSELTSKTAVVVLAFIKLASLVNAAIVCIASEWIERSTDFSTFSKMYGTIIGFLSGAYLPYFFYGIWLKRILYLLPATHVTSIFRQLFLTDLLAGLRPSLGGDELEQFKVSFGVCLKDFAARQTVTRQSQYQILVVEFLLLLVILFLISRRKNKYI